MKNKDEFVIYQITNIINSKIYLGSAKYFAGRKGNHYYKLRNNKHHNKHLQNSYNKYGDVFKFEIIEYCSSENLVEREQYYIDTLNPDYNILKEAFSSLGYKHTEKCKRKMSLNRKGKQNSLGRILSEETKNKIGKKIKESGHTLIINENRKIPIVQLDKNYNFIKEFKSSIEASAELNLYDTNIRSCCRQESGFRKYPKTTGGFKFMYKEQFELERIKKESDGMER